MLHWFWFVKAHDVTDQHARLYHHETQFEVLQSQASCQQFLNMRACHLLQDLPYGSDGVLGLARTWPQGACSLPQAASTHSSFDWEGDRPLNLPMQDLIVYEMHVRGFTQDPSSGVSAPGDC